jgi:hypothetical protein
MIHTLGSMSRRSACSTGAASRLPGCPAAAARATGSTPGRGCSQSSSQRQKLSSTNDAEALVELSTLWFECCCIL